MAPGQSPSRHGAGTETFCPLNLPFSGGGAVEPFVAGGWIILGFLIGRLLIGEGGKVGGRPGGPHLLAS